MEPILFFIVINILGLVLNNIYHGMQWGVGDKKLQNGVLIFISSKDRAIFISVGSGIRSKLSDSTVDKIINRMKPHLKKANWDAGFASAILDVDHVLSTGELQHSDSDDSQLSVMPLVMVACIVGFALFMGHRENKKTADLKRGRCALDSLIKDVKKAEHKVYMSTSCPMCLEPFLAEPELGEASPSTANAAKNATLVPKTLPCGHVFCETCIKQYLNLSAAATCPICRETIRHVDEGTRGEYEPSSQSQSGMGGQHHDDQRQWQQYHPYMQTVLFRSRRIHQLYPAAMDSSTHSVLNAAVHNGTLSDAIIVVERRAVEVESMLAEIARKAANSSSSSGSSRSSFGGGHSSGGRGGRF